MNPVCVRTIENFTNVTWTTDGVAEGNRKASFEFTPDWKDPTVMCSERREGRSMGTGGRAGKRRGGLWKVLAPFLFSSMAPFNPNSATQSDLEIFRSPSSLYLLLTFDSRTSIATHSNQSVLFLLCVCAILCRRVVTKQLKARHSGKHIFASITRCK